MGLIYVICLFMGLVIANGSSFVFLANNSIFKNHLVVLSDSANGSLGGLCDDSVCVFLAGMGRESIVHYYQQVGKGGGLFYFTIMIYFPGFDNV